MQMTGELSVESARKTPSTLLRDYRGFRLVIAMAAVALSSGWILDWAYEPALSAAPTLSERLWQIAPSCLGSAICLICLGWASVILWEGVVGSKSYSRAGSSSLTGTAAADAARDDRRSRAAQLKGIAAVFIAGLVFSGAVGLTAGRLQPSLARGIGLASVAAFWIVMMGFLFRALRSRSPEGVWRKFATFLLAGPMVTLACGALLSEPAAVDRSVVLYWTLRVALVSAILFVPLAVVAGLLPIWLVNRGNFDTALRLNRLLFWTPASNSSTEGWILVMAGRYEQARAYLKPLAFNDKGHPRLTSQEFYLYALALSIDGEDATAEMLFEAAINVPQSGGNFHFGLAESLLSQKKEPERARELIETVLMGFPSSPRSIRQRTNWVQLVAFHAWALASNGRREEAEQRLQQAFAASGGIGNCGLAGMYLPVGHAWLTLGDFAKARASFSEAASLFPQSDLAFRAQKELAKLEEL